MLPQLPSTCTSSMCHITILLFTTLIIIAITSFSQTVYALALQPHNAYGGGCIPAERASLLSFHRGITRDSAGVLASWQGQDCCRWRGVSCSNQTGHVIKLHLPNKSPDPGIVYYPCDKGNSLVGEISPSLLSLMHLEHMDLSMNCLLGPNSHIPHLLGSMENLRYLNLSGIPFTGRVPSQLGNLSKSQHLDLGEGYSGIMNTIKLSRIADWPHTLNMVPSLRVINIAECSLDTASQSLPYLNLTKLEKLDLSYNNWTTQFLKYLSLRWNSDANWLFGKLPDALGNMTSLRVLDVPVTNLNETANLQSLLKNLCCLEILDLSGNVLNGDIVALMEGLPRCAWKNY
ncbi:hypothetical protein VPH35_095425 [Triticum aestivum]